MAKHDKQPVEQQKSLVGGLLDEFLEEHRGEVEEQESSLSSQLDEVEVEEAKLQGLLDKAEGFEFAVTEDLVGSLDGLLENFKDGDVELPKVVGESLASIKVYYAELADGFAQATLISDEKGQKFKEMVLASEKFTSKITELYEAGMKEPLVAELRERLGVLGGRKNELEAQRGSVRELISDVYGSKSVVPENFDPESLEVKRALFERRLRTMMLDPIVKHRENVMPNECRNSERLEVETKLLEYFQKIAGPAVVSKLVKQLEEDAREQHGDGADEYLHELFGRVDISMSNVSGSENGGRRYQDLVANGGEDGRGLIVKPSRGRERVFSFKNEGEVQLYKRLMLANSVLLACFVYQDKDEWALDEMMDNAVALDHAQKQEFPATPNYNGHTTVLKDSEWTPRDANYTITSKEGLQAFADLDFATVVDMQLLVNAMKENGQFLRGYRSTANVPVLFGNMGRYGEIEEEGSTFQRVYSSKGADGVYYDRAHSAEALAEIAEFTGLLKAQARKQGLQEPVLTVQDAVKALEGDRVTTAATIDGYKEEGLVLSQERTRLIEENNALNSELERVRVALTGEAEGKQSLETAVRSASYEKDHLSQEVGDLHRKVATLTAEVERLAALATDRGDKLVAIKLQFNDVIVYLEKKALDIKTRMEALETQGFGGFGGAGKKRKAEHVALTGDLMDLEEKVEKYKKELN